MNTRLLSLAAILLASVSFPRQSAAQDLFVPEDYASIQEAIDAAPSGAVISVANGVYFENIDFGGKDVVVRGSGSGTVLDGSGLGSVVRFVGGEGPGAVLDSFTITGGRAATGGGIEIRDSSPTIVRNVIAGNSAGGSGSGIYIGGQLAEPDVVNNLLAFNTGVLGSDPHTIQVIGSSPRIVNNTILRNDSNAILTSGFGSPDIRNNVLARNGSRANGVKGRGICDFATGTVIQYNAFFRNTIGALLTAGTDFRRIRTAEETLLRDRLSQNIDAAPRYTAGPLPRFFQDLTPSRFIPDVERSRLVHGGDPDPAYANEDGSRNTIGFTGGPLAYPF